MMLVVEVNVVVPHRVCTTQIYMIIFNRTTAEMI